MRIINTENFRLASVDYNTSPNVDSKVENSSLYGKPNVADDVKKTFHKKKKQKPSLRTLYEYRSDRV